MNARNSPSDQVTVSVTLPVEWVRLLTALTEHPQPDHPPELQAVDVADVLAELADHAQQGVYRPGAWEREWLCQAFGYDWLEHLEPDPDPERRQIGWVVPRSAPGTHR